VKIRFDKDTQACMNCEWRELTPNSYACVVNGEFRKFIPSGKLYKPDSCPDFEKGGKK